MTNVVWVAWEWSERRWHWSYSGWGSAWVASVNKTPACSRAPHLRAARSSLCPVCPDRRRFWLFYYLPCWQQTFCSGGMLPSAPAVLWAEAVSSGWVFGQLRFGKCGREGKEAGGGTYLVWMSYLVFAVLGGQRSVCVNAARCLCIVIPKSQWVLCWFPPSRKICIFYWHRSVRFSWKRCCISPLLLKNNAGLTARVQSCSWTLGSLGLQPSGGTCHS